MTEHHWCGLDPDPDNNFGFIYRIDVVESGHAYIGKRQYWKAKRGAPKCKSKVFDKGSPKWKESCWVPSDWEYYSGSSFILDNFKKKFPDYTYVHTLLTNCKSRAILIYSEAKAQWDEDVLVAKLEDGRHKYFNQQIGAIKFRPTL